MILKFHCVYKCYFNNEIIYVGMTTNLDNAVKRNRSDARFKKYKNVEIYYCIVKNEDEAATLRNNLIYSYKPLLNIAKRHKPKLRLVKPEDEWILYDEFKTNTYRISTIKSIPDTHIEEFMEASFNGVFLYSGTRLAYYYRNICLNTESFFNSSEELVHWFTTVKAAIKTYSSDTFVLTGSLLPQDSSAHMSIEYDVGNGFGACNILHSVSASKEGIKSASISISSFELAYELLQRTCLFSDYSSCLAPSI